MKILKTKRLLIFCVAVIVVIFMFLIACNRAENTNTPNPGEIPGNTENGGEPEEAEENYSLTDERSKVPDNIEAEDMNGMKIRLITRSDMEYEFFSEEETGDNVEDAIYRRNKKIEERFNIEFVSVPVADPSGSVSKSVKAEDNAYELIGHNTVNIAGLSLTGALLNFHTIDTVDLSQKWFMQDAVNEVTVNNKLYILPGEACISILEYTYCYFFNKALISDYGLENPYQLVLDGTWTLDKVSEIIKGMYKDLDNDGMKSPGDFYGLATFNISHPVVYTYSSGMRITKTNAGGIPEFVVPSEKLYTNFEKVFNMSCNTLDTFDWYLAPGDINAQKVSSRNAFKNKLALFQTESIIMAKELRDMEDDFGIVPYPKYDKAQEKYYTYADGHSSMFGIPITVQEPRKIGKILVALNAESWKTVVPEYYDVAIKVKFVRDDESVRVLDILLDGRVFDFGYIYDNWNAYGFYMWDLFTRNDNNVASYFEKRQPNAEKHLAKTLEFFEG